ncbi:hypothetical protein QF031_003750 [Pseudarthrobacter defluvii]|uniref:hypothetical protein n=1 Tax=Pseudarthrobacter defluvii TaxID=410837 RepID=UPI002781A64C|nr:hypothetical protein [Pseudarthrobacter defluvii]MDQ0771001.1 hypothetical protein [Pseudarthrobacter defluvii]
MKPYPHYAWAQLIGVPVEIRRDSDVVRSGVVDDAMPEPAALWLAADSGGGRELFTAAEGYQVWILPQPLDGRLCYKMAADQLQGAPTLGR